MPSSIWKNIKIEGFSHTSEIKHLKESHTYTFRVAAENKVGVGPFSESSQDKTYGKISLKSNMVNIPENCFLNLKHRHYMVSADMSHVYNRI